MEKTKSFMRKITQKKYLPIWIFAAIQLVYHILIREPETSDAMWFFRNQLSAYDLKKFLDIRYQTWSSRLVIEGILVYISQNVLVWKIINFMCWMFLAWAIVQLFPENEKDRARWLTMFVLLAYPLWDLATAGWIATSLNYSWVLVFGVFSLNSVARVFYGKKTPVWLGILYAAAAVYGANMEQMCAILLGMNTVAVLYFLVKKTPVSNYWAVLLCWFVSASEFVFIMTCPGNIVRKNQEIINCMPNFRSMNIVDKVSMGFMDTMHHILASGNLLFLLFAAVLAILVFLKSKNLFFRFVSLIPIFWNVILVFFWEMFEEKFEVLAKVFRKNRIIDGTNYEIGVSYIPMMVYLLVLWCILISLVVVCESWIELSFQTLLLGLGMASRVVMGFSPSIYISEERTFFYLYMTMSFSAMWMILRNMELLQSKKKFFEFLKLTAACVLMLAVINSLAAVGIE